MKLKAGTRLGPYEITGLLGVGGMGEVYRAFDAKLGRAVAIKVLPEAFALDAERMGRMEREAKVLASLNHPNIAAIYGFEDSGTPGLVMEIVEGPTLAELIADKPLPIEEALPIAKQICDALEYAHERGIIHRDLKPSNVKVTNDGTVKLLDFGLAKALESESSQSDSSSSPTLTKMATQAGIIIGTAAYMSPEQAKGRSADRRSDIWAFGCVLFEMLTGRMAFCADSATETLAEIIKSEPDWSLLSANAPRPIFNLVQRCLKKDIKQRVQAIGDARITIEEVLAGKHGADSPSSELVPPVSATRTRSRLSMLIAGVLLGAALASSVALWLGYKASHHTGMRFSAVTSFAGIQAQPALSPDGRSVAFISNRDGHFNVYVGLLSGGDLVQITHDSSSKSRPGWSPDGSTIAYAQLNDSGAMDIWEISALGGTPRKVVLNANDPTFNPDGHSLTYANLLDGSIWTSGLDGENPHSLVTLPAGTSGTEPRLSPDGSMLAFISRGWGGGPYSELAVADVATGKFRTITHDGALALSPAWSPDNQSIYFASSRGGTLNIWKIQSDGSHLTQVTAGAGDDTELDISSDGKRMVFATLRMNIGLKQSDIPMAGDAKSQVIASDPARNQFGPTYSPNGDQVAFFTNLKGTEKESIGVADAHGGNATQLVRDSLVNIFPKWSPDGTQLFFNSASLDRSETRKVSISGVAPQTVRKTELEMADAGRDGRLLYQKEDGQLEAFDPGTNKTQELGFIPPNVRNIYWVPGENAATYLVWAPGDDSKLGVWFTDFKSAPRQICRCWAVSYTIGQNHDLWILKGKADLTGQLFHYKLDGSAPTTSSGSFPLLYNLNYFHSLITVMMDVSPDGHHVVYQSQLVLQENIGLIDNLR